MVNALTTAKDIVSVSVAGEKKAETWSGPDRAAKYAGGGFRKMQCWPTDFPSLAEKDVRAAIAFAATSSQTTCP